MLHVTQIGKATEEEKNKLQQEKEEENGISDFKSRQFVNQLPSEEIASQVLPCYVVKSASTPLPQLYPAARYPRNAEDAMNVEYYIIWISFCTLENRSDQPEEGISSEF